MVTTGTLLRDGIDAQAQHWGYEIRQTGPVQMPYLSFVGDDSRAVGTLFAASALRHGVYLHPRHNWFVSAAMTDADLNLALSATDAAFQELRETGVETGEPST